MAVKVVPVETASRIAIIKPVMESSGRWKRVFMIQRIPRVRKKLIKMHNGANQTIRFNSIVFPPD